MSRLNYSKLRHAGKPVEGPKPKPIQGCNTNIKRQPCRVFTAEEKAAWLRELGL